MKFIETILNYGIIFLSVGIFGIWTIAHAKLDYYRYTRLAILETSILLIILAFIQLLLALKDRKNLQKLTIVVIFTIIFAVSAFILGIGPSTHFDIPQAELTSKDSAVQAQVALKQFFNAIASGDSNRKRELLVPAKANNFNIERRIVVESITPLPLPEGYRRDDLQRFMAPIRLWPSDGSFDAGGLLYWNWLLERGDDGKWRVKDWGVG